jgi:hypothetical protein
MSPKTDDSDAIHYIGKLERAVEAYRELARVHSQRIADLELEYDKLHRATSRPERATSEEHYIGDGVFVHRDVDGEYILTTAAGMRITLGLATVFELERYVSMPSTSPAGSVDENADM